MTSFAKSADLRVLLVHEAAAIGELADGTSVDGDSTTACATVLSGAVFCWGRSFE